MDKLLIIDGNNIAYRAFYALPLLQNEKGQYSNSVYGFCNILIKALNDIKPTHVAVAFDYSKHTFRNDLFKDYKATRKPMPEELALQMPVLKSLLSTMGIAIFEMKEIEADDLIGSIACSSDIENVIVSGDRDVLQLINENTSVYLTKKGISETLLMNEKTLEEHMGIKPFQIIELKSLMGDSSDNIPGVPGIGEKTAQTLISKYQTLDGIYSHIDEITVKLKENLVNNKETAYLSKTLATIKTDCSLEFDIESCKFSLPFKKEVADAFRELSFKTLFNKTELFESGTSLVFDLSPEILKPEILKTAEDLKEAARHCLSEKAFSFYLEDEVKFATPAKCFIMSMEYDMFNSGLQLADFMKIFKDVFESGTVKVSYNNKLNFQLFEKYGINPTGEIFDLQLSSYLTNGGYAKKAPDISLFLSSMDKEKKLLSEMELEYLYYNVEAPLTKILLEMEKDGFKVSLSELEKQVQLISGQISRLEEKIHLLAGEEFNINSPKQVAEVLYDKMGLASGRDKSTNAEKLIELYDSHEIIPFILQHRKLQKLLTSFLLPIKEFALKNDCFIHTNFNQTLTATGRLSSSDPNLQNIPTRDEEGRAIRGAFISRFNGGQIVSADYNQIELRILAALSGDENMLSAFRNKEDIHRSTAAKIFNKPLFEVTPEERRIAKSVNFGVLYGISSFGLSKSINCTFADAKNFILKYFKTFGRVKQYIDENVAEAYENGFTKTILGRRRVIPEIKSYNKTTHNFGERVAMNAPIQGTAADIIKIAMVKLHKKLKEENLQSRLILQIHDELLIDAHPDELEKVKQLIKECMENPVKLPIDISVEISAGTTWLLK